MNNFYMDQSQDTTYKTWMDDGNEDEMEYNMYDWNVESGN